MAIPVEGYGNITKGNAKEIYKAWKAGDIDLNKAQQSKCESFLSPQDFDEVEYDSDVTGNRGKSAINTEGTDNKNGAATASVGTVASGGALAGTIVAICNGMTKLTSTSKTNGFTSLGCSIPAAAAAALALTMAFMFDPALKDRKSHSDAAANDNAQLDNYNETLANTMEMMNEDVEHYNETQDLLTTTVNTQVSQGADLQMQLDTAMAVGDSDKAQQLREELKMLKEADNSELTDELAETGAGLEEYKSLNVEANGCAESGQTVSKFLKEGKGMGAAATVNAVLAGATTILLGIAAIVGAIPKIWTPAGPLDAAPAIASVVLWNVAMLAMGATTTKMITTAKDEFECGSNGDEMQTHVSSLNDMITQQGEYTSDTESQYADSDKAAAESKGEAEAKAGKTVATNKEELGDKAKDEEAEPAIL